MIETSFGVKTLKNIGLLGEDDSSEASLLYSESGNTIDDHHSEYSRKSVLWVPIPPLYEDTLNVSRLPAKMSEIKRQCAINPAKQQTDIGDWDLHRKLASLKSPGIICSLHWEKKLWNELQNTKQMLVLLYPIPNGTCRILPKHPIKQIYSFHACRS